MCNFSVVSRKHCFTTHPLLGSYRFFLAPSALGEYVLEKLEMSFSDEGCEMHYPWE